MDIALLKKYLKFDDDVTEMDDILQGYMGAAEQYIKNAGCTIDYDNKMCEIIITILVTKMLENPDLLTTKLGENTGLSINGLIAQLRLSQQITG